MTPLVIRTVSEMLSWRKNIGSVSVGFVPTMGALHEGHQSLLEKSRIENEYTVLSIFVNPTQFNQAQDLAKYPRTWEADLKMAEESKAAVIFFPSYEEVYPDDFTFSIDENDYSRLLCGASRPGHFKGVLTVVTKLVNIVRPEKVYMGEKDYQQLHLIRKMVDALFLPTEIVACPTVRNKEGLALSSRNSRLSEADQKKAALIYKTVTTSKTAKEARADLQRLGFKIDYLVDIEKRRYVAAFLPSASGEGEVRLIDNVPL